MRLLAAALVAGVLAAAPGIPALAADPQGKTAPTTGAPTIGGVAEWSLDQSGVFEPRAAVIRDDGAWLKLWSQIGQRSPGRLPAGAMAIAIHLGQRKSGGYGVRILGIETATDAIVVGWRETEPPPGAMVTMALTSPVLVRLVPASPLPVMFERAVPRPDTPTAK